MKINNKIKLLSDAVELSPVHSKSISLKYDFNQNKLRQIVVTDTLVNLFRNLSSTIGSGKCATTVTGSYGMGKSFAMLLFGALLGQDKKLKDIAVEKLGSEESKNLHTLAGGIKRVFVPIVCHRAPLESLLYDALVEQKIIEKKKRKENLLQFLEEKFVYGKPKVGLLIILDEMGKTLEYHSTSGDSDIYFFQQISELASRSEGRLVLLGTLHQSLSLYFDELDEIRKQEWKKVSGRFDDIPMAYPPLEQCEVISEMLQQKIAIPASVKKLAKNIVSQFSKDKKAPDVITKCYPLHPSTSVFLSNYVRSGVAQNRRSLSSFITGHDTLGLRWFIDQKPLGSLYTLDLLWDYVNENMGASLISSSYFHKWLLASDAIERAERLSDSVLSVKIVKIIALYWLFGGSITQASKENIQNALMEIKDINIQSINQSLSFLEEKSIIIYRKHLSAYAVFEGSDFNLEESLSESCKDSLDEKQLLKMIGGVKPVFARRHYLKTGTLRHLDLCIYLSNEDTLFLSSENSFGLSVIDVSERGASIRDYEQIIKKHTPEEKEYKTIIYTKCGEEKRKQIRNLIIECQKIIEINRKPAVTRDRIAEKEVKSRMSLNQRNLNQLLIEVKKESKWFDDKNQELLSRNLRTITSTLADNIFCDCPEIINEMINLPKLSGVAKRGVKDLMFNLKNKSSKNGFGYHNADKFPLDRAIYHSVIEKFFEQEGDVVFSPKDPKISKLWQCAEQKIRQSKERVPLRDIAEVWQNKPYGLNQGLIPLLLWVFYLAKEKHLSLYDRGLYKAEMTKEDIDTFFLLNNYEIFWVESTKASELIFDELRSFLQCNSWENLEISRALVARLDKLPHWTKTTNTLKGTGVKLRDYLKRAKDPNEVILNKLPEIYGRSSSSQITDDIKQLEIAQDNLLDTYAADILSKLGCSNWEKLRTRMAKLRGNTGNMLFERFISLLSDKDKQEKVLPKVVSLLSGKPLAQWTDTEKTNCDQKLQQFCDMLSLINSSCNFDDYSEEKKKCIKKRKDKIIAELKKENIGDALTVISLVNAELRDMEKHGHGL